jgi:predicted DNA-binding protein
MTNKTMQEATFRQFPIRLEAPLADALDRYSEATNIPKTTISRIALTKFLNELEKSGARAMLQQVCKI